VLVAIFALVSIVVAKNDIDPLATLHADSDVAVTLHNTDLVLADDNSSLVEGEKEMVTVSPLPSGNRYRNSTWLAMRTAGIKMDAPSPFCFVFNVRGTEDASIILAENRNDVSTRAYEIMLGANGNTRSEIRIGAKGRAVESYPVGDAVPGKILAGMQTHVSVWISYADSELTVGRPRLR